MKVIGNLDLSFNEIQNFAVDPTDEFPANPREGQIVFKNGRVLACIQVASGVPVWVPMTQEITSYIHTQDVASDVWTIVHGFNNRNVFVQVSTSDGEVIIPDSIVLTDADTATVSFETEITGTAVIMLGTFDGATKPNVAYSLDFTNVSTVVVTHSLGYFPAIRVYVGNQEVQPDSITQDSVNQATITFSAPQTGVVRCI